MEINGNMAVEINGNKMEEILDSLNMAVNQESALMNNGEIDVEILEIKEDYQHNKGNYISGGESTSSKQMIGKRCSNEELEEGEVGNIEIWIPMEELKKRPNTCHQRPRRRVNFLKLGTIPTPIPKRKARILRVFLVLPLESLDLPPIPLMVKALLWNIRGVGGSLSKDRVKNLCRIHDIQMLVLIEPLIAASKIDSVKHYLGFDFFFGNCNNKIWLFLESFVSLNVIVDLPQVVHIIFYLIKLLSLLLLLMRLILEVGGRLFGVNSTILLPR
ncbi:hypothetical protein KFK09_000522 [Dendrobium nobile]|uniref:Uncharacterized protein n=1 Tax=Dendrobium nobile TaxID=94219 RepID=A0A8T3CEZ3_DENNO|nr:hypothetical protein KFK09_000522 [Dendrobium nobile]